jgi:NADPH:quinone reductase
VKAVAARLVEHGKPLQVIETELPAAGAGEAVVEMLYGGMNPVDRYRAAGRTDARSPVPRTLGAEGSGMFEGRPVVVFGHGVGSTRDGIWATRAVVPRAALVDVPAGIDLQRAAVMGVAGVTAWRTATDVAKVTKDDRVLVLGATGGVGSVIVSVVHGIGATVWGQTIDPASASWLKDRGADKVVAAGADELASQLAELQPTVVFDPLGDGFTGAAIASMARGGRLVIFGTTAGPTGTVPLEALYRSALRIQGYGGLGEPADVISASLASALRALADGRLDVSIGKELPLSQVNEGLELLGAHKFRGKLVLDLQA